MTTNCYWPFWFFLSVTLLLGWAILLHCSIALCWALLGVAVAIIIAGAIICFTSLAPCIGAR